MEDQKIAKNVVMKRDVFLLNPKINLEEGVSIGERTLFASPDPGHHGSSETHIKREAYIGQGCLVKAGITVGSRAIVQSGSVIDRDVPPNVIVGGNPIKIVGYVDSQKQNLRVSDQSISHSSENDPHLFHFPIFSDLRGDLIFAEIEKDIPFSVKRFFLVFNVPSSELRGEHAHKRCHQLLICVKGSVSVVTDNGKQRKEYVLDSPTKGLHLPAMTWGVQYNYSEDATLLVIASERYDADDYIRDYDEFLKLIPSF
jgi:carbonic anhydrase/acetyltransferase-like protein (isoleucine patch superfamily)